MQLSAQLDKTITKGTDAVIRNCAWCFFSANLAGRLFTGNTNWTKDRLDLT